VKSLLHDPSVTRVTYGINGKYIDVNGAAVQATLVLVGKGPMAFSLIDGQYPRRDGELALGTQTLAVAKAHIGSRVSVAVIGPTGQSRTTEFTVTGTIVPAFTQRRRPGRRGDRAASRRRGLHLPAGARVGEVHRVAPPQDRDAPVLGLGQWRLRPRRPPLAELRWRGSTGDSART
jgi:hypothetical protein